MATSYQPQKGTKSTKVIIEVGGSKSRQDFSRACIEFTILCFMCLFVAGFIFDLFCG
jgi:hypothetical protein